MDSGEFARRWELRNQAIGTADNFYGQNRTNALFAAALWLSGPGGGMVADDVVNAARVFERFLNE